MESREGASLLAGGIAGTLLGASLASLIASKPAQAASDQEKLDYVIQLAQAQALENAAIADALLSLNATMKNIREINGIDFAFDPMRYIVWKLRSGEAYPDRGSYYQLLAPGATFTGTFIMPETYVWIGIREGVTVSQNAAFSMIRTVDGDALPWMVVPAVVNGEMNWAETLPFGLVIREVSVVTYTNNDLANQWLVGGFYGIYLRKDVWEADSRVMDLVARKYSTPPEVTVVEG